MNNQPQNNPYQLLLGLPEEVSQPDYYQLLKLERFTRDEPIIKNAGLDQYAKLMSWQNSNRHHQHARRLMEEVTTARNVLLDPAQKAEYDRQLREQLSSPSQELTEDAETKDWLDALTEEVEQPYDLPLPPRRAASPRKRKRSPKREHSQRLMLSRMFRQDIPKPIRLLSEQVLTVFVQVVIVGIVVVLPVAYLVKIVMSWETTWRLLGRYFGN